MKILNIFLILLCSVSLFSQTKEKEPIAFSIIDEVPKYKGCETFNTNAELKKCFGDRLRKHIQRNFNADIINCLETKLVYNRKKKKYEKQCVSVLGKGKKRIYVQFKIGITGEIENINVRAPHPRLKEEAIRMAKGIPKMIPGKQGGKPVGVNYTLPITLNAI